jgi:hypothetical protein
MVALSLRLDKNFKKYEPVWPTDFDVPNTADDVASLTQLANFTELTPTLRKRVLKVVVKLLDQIERIPEEERAEIVKEIQALSEEAQGETPPEPAAQVGAET